MAKLPEFGLCATSGAARIDWCGRPEASRTWRRSHCFPISQPDAWISIRTADGTELACIEDPRTLPADVWQLLKEDLARREFVPIIKRIVRVSGNSEPCEWQVETDRGPTQFVLKSEEDVRRIGDQEILILDAHGTRYHIPDLRALDVKSRRIVEWYV